jgi:SpoIID/LytB domain protein
MKTSDITKPYLYRDYACTHCKENKLYRWKETITIKDFLKQLKKHPTLKITLKEISDISSIKILEKDTAGIVYKIGLYHRKSSITITTKDLKSSLDANLKSLAMTIKKEKNSIVFSGFGYGHNIGLCQLGARTLVDKGWNYQKILSFYYPQTMLNTIKKIRL